MILINCFILTFVPKFVGYISAEAKIYTVSVHCNSVVPKVWAAAP